jgi:hypothetical protein
MQFILLLHEHEHDWRTMLLFAVGLLIVIVLIDSLAAGVLKRLNSAGRTQVARKRKHKRGK